MFDLSMDSHIFYMSNVIFPYLFKATNDYCALVFND